MERRTFSDGSDGTVVIRPGRPSSGGGSGGGYGGGFGGNRVGARGGPTRSAKGIKKRQQAALKRRAEEAKAAAKAKADAVKAQAQARVEARQQALTEMVQRYTSTRAEVDRNFASKKQQLDASLQKEISAARRPPEPNSTERWQLYTITKEKKEIDGLIARKTTELNARNLAARVFDGQDPLTRSADDYRTRLDQFGAALDEGYRAWVQAYTAAREAWLLSEQIKALTDKSSALARHHAEQTVVWREREANWERQRQYAEQRAERIRFKQQVDESTLLQVQASPYPECTHVITGGRWNDPDAGDGFRRPAGRGDTGGRRRVRCRGAQGLWTDPGQNGPGVCYRNGLFTCAGRRRADTGAAQTPLPGNRDSRTGIGP